MKKEMNRLRGVNNNLEELGKRGNENDGRGFAAKDEMP